MFCQNKNSYFHPEKANKKYKKGDIKGIFNKNFSEILIYTSINKNTNKVTTKD